MPIATITKEFTFDAAHMLPNHEGKCRRLHGHTYHVTVTARGRTQPISGHSEEGMVVDFGRITDIYKHRIEPLCDHQYLNETVPVERTTAELLAAWMLGEMRSELPQVVAVRVSETRSSWAEVTVDDLDASEA